MTDVEAVVREYLASAAGLTAYTGERIYASRNLPAGYKPTDGPAVVFGIRGGGQDYTSHVLMPALQFRCYGATQTLARATDRALHSALNEMSGRGIKWARMEGLGQLLTEPETLWWFVLSFWDVWLGN